MQNQPLVKIIYAESENEVTTSEKAACERLQKAINDAVESFHNETLGLGLLGIELYPCDASVRSASWSQLSHTSSHEL